MKKIILFILVAAVSISLSAYTFDASVQKDLCELQKQMKWGMNYGTDKNCTVRRESEESEAIREGSYVSCKG